MSRIRSLARCPNCRANVARIGVIAEVALAATEMWDSGTSRTFGVWTPLEDLPARGVIRACCTECDRPVELQIHSLRRRADHDTPPRLRP